MSNEQPAQRRTPGPRLERETFIITGISMPPMYKAAIDAAAEGEGPDMVEIRQALTDRLARNETRGGRT
jgi:hypothetical protein